MELTPLQNWKPLRDLVMVGRIPLEDKKGRLYIIHKDDEQSTRGIVLATGPKVTDVKPGDVVMFGPWSDLLTLNDEVAIFPEGDCRWIEN